MPGPLPDQHAAILAQKLADGQLALFIGAGLSRQSIAKDGSGRRLPLWKELAEQVAKTCQEDLDAYSGNILDLFDAIELGQSRFTLEEALRVSLHDEAFDPSPAHMALVELPWAAVYTTNYDGLLGRILNADPVFEEEQYDKLQLSTDKQPRLFHVHGTLAKPHTLTREDYRLWADKHPRAYRNLEQVVLNKTVLFAGYSLSDPHLADGVLPTIRKITAGREKRLYAWMWKMPPNQVQLLDRRDKIEVIPIGRDEDWAASFRQVADALCEVGRAPGAAVVAASLDFFAYDRQQYFAAIDARHGIANLQGLYVTGAGYARRDVLLSEVFVEPDLQVKTSPKEAADSGEWMPLRTALRERAEDQREGEKREREQAIRRQHSLQVMARERKLLIIGAPGEGKSTLLRYYLLQATARWREHPTEHPFPILVRLSDWEAEGGASDGRLFRFVGSRMPAMGEIGSKAVELWLKGPVLWLLDGIDEIRDPRERVRLVEEVEATSAIRPQDRWVIVTRPAGEPRGGLGAGWTRAVLPNLADAQVEQVLARWGSVLAKKEGLHLDARQVAHDLRRDLGLRQVRTNALLLTLAVLFFKSRKRLPHDRWEFYETAEKALRDAWVNYRIGSAERYLPGDYLPELLERLALAGMENGRVLFPREALKSETRAVLAERGYTGREQSEEIQRFLRAAEDLIGVLVEQGPDRFGFLHLTFQEFYAARAILHRSGEATRLIARYWDHPDWREVWPLYALAVQNDSARYAELFEAVLSHMHPLDHCLFRPQLACLRLAGLGTMPYPTPVAAVLDWAGAVLAGGVDPLLDVLRVLAGWERALTEGIRLKVISRLDGENWHVRQAAIEALAGAVADPAVRAALLARLTDDEESVIHAALKALAGAPSEENVRALLLARLGGDDEDARLTAVRALSGAVNEKDVRMGLLARLNDASFVVRREAIRALESAVGEPEVRSAVVAQLADHNGGVRAASAKVLTGAVGEVDVREMLLVKLADGEGRVRAAVAQALAGSVAEGNVRKELLARLTDVEAVVRDAAAKALAGVVDETEVQVALLARLSDSTWFVRSAAARALASVVREPDVRTGVLARLGDEDKDVRKAAVRALTLELGEADVRTALVARLGDEDEDVRKAAVRALTAGVGEAEVQAGLLARLFDHSADIRSAAVQALKKAISTPEVRSLLLARLNDHAPDVRRAAVEALAGAVGKAEVREVVLARLGDKNAGVRSAAAKVLSAGILAEKFGLPAGEIDVVYP